MDGPVVLCTAGGEGIPGFARMVQAIAGWDLQVELLGRPMAFYLVLSGALWGLAGLAATLLLQFRSGWAVPAAWVGTIFFPLSFWLERIFFVRSPQDWINYNDRTRAFGEENAIRWVLNKYGGK